MEFQPFWQSLTPTEKEELADNAETSVGYLHLIAGRHRRPSPEMAKKLVAASGGRVTRETLRPDLWGEAS